MTLHPSNRRLNQFADGEVSAKWQRARISRHLQACAECRNTVMAIRALGRDAQALEVPPLPEDLRSRVLSAAAQRAPAIVPVADPPRRGWAWQRLAWVGGGAALAAVVIRMVVVPAEVRSEASMLEFTPDEPALGARVTVTYRATPRFAGLTELRLRARYHRAADGPSVTRIVPVVAAILTNDGSGSYRGTLELPPDVVYAAFAVEDMNGRVVDAHQAVGWELFTHHGSIPSRDALLQGMYEATGRDLGLAIHRATRATELYPDLVWGWVGRGDLDWQALGGAASDSLRAFYLERLHAFHDSLRDAPVQQDLAESMYFFASVWQAREIADWWRERLLQEWPKSAAAGQLRAVTIRQRGASDPDHALRALEELWAEESARHPAVPQMAFEFARDAGNSAATVRWAARQLVIEPASRFFLAQEMATIPALRDTVLAWLRAEAESLERPQDARRPLYRSVEQQREWDKLRRSETLGLMGRVELAGGDTEKALALLHSAIAQGWNLELIEAAADARLDAGDVSGAIEMLGRLAADPAYVSRDVTAWALRLVRPDQWATHVERGRDHMIATTLAQARARIMPRPVRVGDETGAERDLHEFLAGHVSVMAFYWPGCRMCVEELLQLQEVQQQMPASFRVVLVTSRRMLPHESEWLRAEGVEFPVVVDSHGDVANALEPWGRPFYVMLDRHGTARFIDTNPQDIPRQALALAVNEPPVT